jgi:hypothetical protein
LLRELAAVAVHALRAGGAVDVLPVHVLRVGNEGGALLAAGVALLQAVELEACGTSRSASQSRLQDLAMAHTGLKLLEETHFVGGKIVGEGNQGVERRGGFLDCVQDYRYGTLRLSKQECVESIGREREYNKNRSSSVYSMAERASRGKTEKVEKSAPTVMRDSKRITLARAWERMPHSVVARRNSQMIGRGGRESEVTTISREEGSIEGARGGLNQRSSG